MSLPTRHDSTGSCLAWQKPPASGQLRVQRVHCLPRWCTTHPRLAEEVGDETRAHTSLQSNKKAPQAAVFDGFWWFLMVFDGFWGFLSVGNFLGRTSRTRALDTLSVWSVWILWCLECTELCHCPYQLIAGQHYSHYSIPFSMHQNGTWQPSSRCQVVDIRASTWGFLTERFNTVGYPLVMTNIAIENDHRNRFSSGFTHW